MRNLLRMGTMVACLAIGAVAQASLVQYNFTMSGAQEFPGPGDPDGSGNGVLIIDDSTSPPNVDWNITVAGILLPLTGAHIHQAPAGVAGSVVVNFSAQLTGTDLFDADLTAVLANPSGFYVNVHNADFPGGAIRGQLPEPTSVSLLALGAVAVLRRRH